MSLDELLRAQEGVICRAQVLACGYDDDFIESRVRRRHWARAHRGVYVNHTGSPSWSQQLWAALLFYGDAAACDESALALHALRAPSEGEPLHVAVDQSRRVTPLRGVRLHRVTSLSSEVHPSRRPATMRLETAVLRTAARQKRDAAAVAVVADACQSRRTTARRLADRLALLPRMRRRAFLLDVLEDVATGAFSVLEHRYLIRVERPHGLPTAARQRRVVVGRRPAYRDVEYLGGALVVELDGRLWHDSTEDRWADLERDIDNVVTGSVNLRLGWGQVLEQCRAARAVARMLAVVGWRGELRPCGRGCTGTVAPS